MSVFDINSFYEKIIVLGLTYPNTNNDMSKFTKVSILTDSVVPIYQYCQDSFEDNWIWSRPSGTFSEHVDLYFKHKDDALIFSLKYSELVIHKNK